jgi:DNA-binding XRE family transcriptional regulator
MISKENVGEKLLEHRDKEKLTQVKLSKEIGISVQAISAIESGEVKPQTMTLFKIKNYLKTFNMV